MTGLVIWIGFGLAACMAGQWYGYRRGYEQGRIDTSISATHWTLRILGKIGGEELETEFADEAARIVQQDFKLEGDE